VAGMICQALPALEQGAQQVGGGGGVGFRV